MRLAVTLDLRGFIERLPTHTAFGIFPVDPFPIERLDNWKHTAIAEIAVVGQREDLSACLLLRGGHPLPKVAGIRAPEGRQCRERLDKAGFRSVVAPCDIAMQI